MYTRRHLIYCKLLQNDRQNDYIPVHRSALVMHFGADCWYKLECINYFKTNAKEIVLYIFGDWYDIYPRK